MLNERETELVLDHTMIDCRKFWERQGYDEREAFIKALEEIEEMTTDPMSRAVKSQMFPQKRNLLNIEKWIQDFNFRKEMTS